MPEEIHLLHNAARRYCVERADHVRQHYAELASAESSRAGAGYSDAAYAVFPRYQVLDAILTEVESFTPADFQSLEEAREFLLAAAETAQDVFTKHVHPIAAAAMNDERKQFRQFIAATDAHNAQHAENASLSKGARQVGERNAIPRF